MHYFSNLNYFYIRFLYICTVVLFVSGLIGAHILYEWQLDFSLLFKKIYYFYLENKFVVTNGESVGARDKLRVWD